MADVRGKTNGDRLDDEIDLVLVVGVLMLTEAFDNACRRFAVLLIFVSNADGAGQEEGEHTGDVGASIKLGGDCDWENDVSFPTRILRSWRCGSPAEPG